MSRVRRFDDPDDDVVFGGATASMISIAGLTVSRTVQPVGWRWSVDFRPLVGGDWCQAHHVGMVVSGRQRIDLEDGTTFEVGPGELFDIPPGHDGRTVGDEPCVAIEWSGVQRWIGGTIRNRVLTSLLFTDIVDSTTLAARVGDQAWEEQLSMHLHASLEAIERFGGRQISTTGDGVLAMFAAAADGVRCAMAIADAAERQGLAVRGGIHVGEVELAGSDVRGLAVHEAARIMAIAGGGEIVVSDTVASLARPDGLRFEDAGIHELKGVPEPRHLFLVLR